MGSSYQNQREASFVATFVDRLAAAASGSRQGRGAQAVDGRGGGPVRGGGGVFRVGVITPYRGQVQCIRQELGSSRRADDGGVDVEVREDKGVPSCSRILETPGKNLAGTHTGCMHAHA